MDRDHTFDLPDLTEDFWKTVVFAQKEHPSGMGGPGCVWLVSEDGKVYFFGFEETPFYKCDELFPIFETTDERIGRHYKYKAEDHGWKYLEKENALIREDILDAYSKEILRRVLIAECRAAVGRTIIHQNQFNIGECLAQHALHTLLQIFFGIVNRNDNTDFRHMTYLALSLLTSSQLITCCIAREQTALIAPTEKSNQNFSDRGIPLIWL